MAALVTVPFRGDTLFALRDGDAVRVAIKPISDRLSLDWSSQHKRTKRDAILAEGLVVMTMPSAGGPQQTTTLPLDLLPGWLFGIEASRVKPEARDLVLTYQRECHAVLYRHFFAPQPAPDRSTADDMRLPIASTRTQLVAECRRIYGPRAAHKLWARLIQPDVPEMAASAPVRVTLFGDARDVWCERVVAALASADGALDARRLMVRASLANWEFSAVIGRLEAHGLVQGFLIHASRHYRLTEQQAA